MGVIREAGRAGILVKTILHIGANTGQEREAYQKGGATNCYWVEPIPEVYEQLCRNLSEIPGNVAVQALCSDTKGEKVRFHVANNGGQSSSMLDLGSHTRWYPSVHYERYIEMTTSTVDQLVADGTIAHLPDLLVVDTQGADLKVLRGAKSTLASASCLLVEVSHDPLYDGGCTFLEIVEFLRDQGFVLWSARFGRAMWGNAFFVRPLTFSEEDLPGWDGNLALNRPAAQSSIGPHTGADPQGAVNGQKTGGFGFHTAKEENPWWQVDLGASHPIREVRVYNREGRTADRAINLRILFSRDGTEWEQVWDQGGVLVFGGKIYGPLRALFDDKSARYVRLTLPGKEYLHLDEVEIY